MENKMMKTTVLAIALITTFAIGSAEARPGRGKGHGRHGPHGDMGMCMKNVDLTAEQRDQVDMLKAENRKKAAPIREELRTLKKQARPLWSAADLDDDAIFAVHRKMRALAGQLEELRLGLRIDTMSLLTPEQRAEMAEAKAERKKERGEKGKKGKRGKKRHGKKGYGKQSFSRDAAPTPAAS